MHKPKRSFGQVPQSPDASFVTAPSEPDVLQPQRKDKELSISDLVTRHEEPTRYTAADDDYDELVLNASRGYRPFPTTTTTKGKKAKEPEPEDDDEDNEEERAVDEDQHEGHEESAPPNDDEDHDLPGSFDVRPSATRETVSTRRVKMPSMKTSSLEPKI